MINVVVGGQLEKQTIADKIKSLAKDKIDVVILNDVEAAMAVQNGTANYYFGACDTGGGGALAMDIAILSINKCKTIATQSNRSSREEIKVALNNGVVAFGFVWTQLDYCVENLVELILEKDNIS